MPPVDGTGPHDSGPPITPVGRVRPSSVPIRSAATSGLGTAAPSPGAVYWRDRYRAV